MPGDRLVATGDPGAEPSGGWVLWLTRASVDGSNRGSSQAKPVEAFEHSVSVTVPFTVRRTVSPRAAVPAARSWAARNSSHETVSRNAS